MKRHAVTSTTFASIGYDREQHVLEAEFHNGGIYRYYDLPLRVWLRFRHAVSKGRFFARHIRDRYRFSKVENEKA